MMRSRSASFKLILSSLNTIFISYCQAEWYFFVDGAVAVLVEEVEGSFEVLELLLV